MLQVTVALSSGASIAGGISRNYIDNSQTTKRSHLVQHSSVHLCVSSLFC